MKRKQKTDQAIAKLKQIHHKCLLCYDKPEGAHILPRNNPAKNYDSSRLESLIPLCRTHHREYDSNHTHFQRLKWLLSKGLYLYSERLQEFLGYAIIETE